MNEYGMSLRKPDKRFQIKQAHREERASDCLKNIWNVRKFFRDDHVVNPPVIKGLCTGTRAHPKDLLTWMLLRHPMDTFRIAVTFIENLQLILT